MSHKTMSHSPLLRSWQLPHNALPMLARTARPLLSHLPKTTPTARFRPCSAPPQSHLWAGSTSERTRRNSILKNYLHSTPTAASTGTMATPATPLGLHAGSKAAAVTDTLKSMFPLELAEGWSVPLLARSTSRCPIAAQAQLLRAPRVC